MPGFFGFLRPSAPASPGRRAARAQRRRPPPPTDGGRAQGHHQRWAGELGRGEPALRRGDARRASNARAACAGRPLLPTSATGSTRAPASG